MDELEKQFFSVFDIEDIVLNHKNCSQPSPFLGWVRVAGQNKIDVTNVRAEVQHIVEDYNKQVFAWLPVRKGDEVHIEGNFLWGRFYKMILQENNQ